MYVVRTLSQVHKKMLMPRILETKVSIYMFEKMAMETDNPWQVSSRAP